MWASIILNFRSIVFQPKSELDIQKRVLKIREN